MNKMTILLREQLEKEGAAIIAKLIEAAKNGEAWAIKLCVGQMSPGRVDLELPRAETASDVARSSEAVIESAAAGELRLGEAQDFMGLLEARRRTIETAELEARVASLEEDAAEEGSRRWSG